ncbi:MAG: 5'-methylthioadenosine/S-adenosylhomocysteine nucleosidase [Opitutaceae bacterium]|nr:5'-methylthioadenosine/S-adenosylhomocysteine nucleosidase [Opitutaceae bacterium]
MISHVHRVAAILVLFCVLHGARAAQPLYALCAAYPPEIAALHAAFGVDEQKGFTRTMINGLAFHRGTYGGKDVVVFRTGVSLVNAAYQLQLALERFPITHVLFAGVAGGIDPALQVGDVVIPERWAYHAEAAYLNEDGRGGYFVPHYLKPKLPNFGMIFPTETGVAREGEEAFQRRADFPADAMLLAAARRALPKLPALRKGGREIAVTVGGVGVAGPVFMDNAKYREWVFRVWQARCLDMESTALAHVAYVNRKPILIVRGLSDLAGAQHGANPIDDNEASVSAIAVRVLRAIVDEL